jgi:hypothetical protein
MVPVTVATQSTPLPTVSERAPRTGGYGRGGAVVHGTSCHSVLGYEDLKHPFFGTGVRDMVARQVSRACADGGWEVACGADGTGWAKAVKDDKSPDKRLGITMMPRTLVKRPRAELANFIGFVRRCFVSTTAPDLRTP